jgi:hypothetical protein
VPKIFFCKRVSKGTDTPRATAYPYSAGATQHYQLALGAELNQHRFLVVGLFGTGGPVTVDLEEFPFVNQELDTGPGWEGIGPGTRLRVTYVNLRPEHGEGMTRLPSSMIYVVEV